MASAIASRFNSGQLFRISSMLLPLPRRWSIVSTGTRVPLKVNLPWQTRGSLTRYRPIFTAFISTFTQALGHNVARSFHCTRQGAEPPLSRRLGSAEITFLVDRVLRERYLE